MIEFKRIQETDGLLHNYMVKVLTESFPSDEYRDLGELDKYIETVEAFHACIIIQDNMAVGILNYWVSDSFIYIEHFATDTKVRNKGIGTKCLELFKAKVHCPIILEAEETKDELSGRRIAFYKRNGFNLLPQAYIQPAYKAGAKAIPMRIMATEDIDFEKATSWLYRNVYNARGQSQS